MTQQKVKAILTEFGTLIGPKSFEIIKKKTVVSKFIQFTGKTLSYPQARRVSVRGRDFFQVPRSLVEYDSITREKPEKILEPQDVSLLDYQEIVVDRVHETMKKTGSFFLQMDTGLGKSFVAAGLINKFRVKTLIVVANRVLEQQMFEDLEKALPFVDTQKGKKFTEDAAVQIMIINSAVSQGEDFFKRFGLVIMDEVHSYCTDNFMRIFSLSDHSRYTFGMTATPERLDSMDKVCTLHLGPAIMAKDIYETLESCKPGKFYGRVLRVDYSGSRDYTNNITNKNGVLSTVLMAKQFLEDPDRMKIAATMITDLYDYGRNIYVFCQTKDPLRILRDNILAFSNKDPEYQEKLANDIHIVTGDSTNDQTKDARSNAKIFLTTYALSSKGLSLPRFDTLLFLTPMKSNMRQIIGRIFRKGSDETIERIVIDIVDIKTKIKRQWSKRLQEYKARSMNVTSVSIGHKDQRIVELLYDLNSPKRYDLGKLQCLGHEITEKIQQSITKNVEYLRNICPDYIKKSLESNDDLEEIEDFGDDPLEKLMVR